MVMTAFCWKSPPDPNDPNDPNVVAEIVEDSEHGQVMKINGRGMQVDGPFDIRTSFTLTFWTKIDLPRSGRYFSGGPWWFRTDDQAGSDHVWIEIRYPGGNFLNKADTTFGDPNSDGQLDGQWHHYAMVLEDSGTFRIYFDGVETPYRDADKTRVHDFNGVDTIYFGTSDESFGNALQGCMDEVAIYNVALSADAVADIMLATTLIIKVGPIDSLEAEVDPVDPNTLLAVLNINGNDVNDLILGTTTTDFEKYDTHPAADADNFSLAVYASLGDSTVIQTVFDVPVTTIFILERGANDSGFFQPIDADGNPIGGPLAFTKADFQFQDTGLKIQGQKAGGIAIVADVPINGLLILPPVDKLLGIDPASISAIPAP